MSWYIVSILAYHLGHLDAGIGLGDIGAVSHAGGSTGGDVVLCGIALRVGVMGGVAVGGITRHCGTGLGVLTGSVAG